MKGRAERKAVARSHERFRIPSYLQFFERQTCSRARGTPGPQLSFFFFAKKFFRAFRLEKFRGQRSRLQPGSNEVETGKYSGFWLVKKLRVFGLLSTFFVLFPAFTPEHF